jgi:hypothetical protein
MVLPGNFSVLATHFSIACSSAFSQCSAQSAAAHNYSAGAISRTNPMALAHTGKLRSL